MAHLYFCDEHLNAESTSVSLTGDEAHHAAQVARLRVGEGVSVSDGRGWRADGIARSVSKNRVEIDVSGAFHEEVTGLVVSLVQALAKGDRDELAVQAATELGVSRVIPWQAERSISRWEGDKRSKGVARWQSICRESAKQALRSRVPAVHELVTTSGIVAATDGADILVLDPRSTRGIGDWARENPTARAIAVVVGPEGGITESELSYLEAAGATAVRLGKDIMRTSTAGPAAISALNSLLGKW